MRYAGKVPTVRLDTPPGGGYCPPVVTEGESMTVFRRVLVAGGVVAGLAGAYFAGAAMNRPAPAGPEGPTAARSQAPEPATEINGVKIPDQLPPAKPDAAAGAVRQPADVLTGAQPVPLDVLRSPPPAKQPDFVVPDLSKK
jgi:hypothetical protein